MADESPRRLIRRNDKNIRSIKQSLKSFAGSPVGKVNGVCQSSAGKKVCLSLAGGESTFTLGTSTALDRILKEAPDMKRTDVKRWLR